MELSKAKIELYGSLSTKKMRQRYRLFLAEGEKCALDMIDAFELECLVATDEWQNSNKWINDKFEGKVFTVKGGSMRKISSLSTSPSVIAVFHLPVVDSLIPSLPLDNGKLYLMLDGIQDPGNLGTIIRTAHWFGIDTIFASHDTVDVFNPKVVQSTMGSLRSVKVIYCDLATIIEVNPEMPVYGMLLDGVNIYTSRISSVKGFIVMGNEGNGISTEIKKFITNPLFIPPCHTDDHPESLNVAIATAITLSWFRGQ